MKLKNYEARLRAKDGSIKHVLITSNVLWKEQDFLDTDVSRETLPTRKQAERDRERLIVELQRTQDQLLEKVRELEEFHEIVIGRELKMITLEKEIEGVRAENIRLKTHAN